MSRKSAIFSVVAGLFLIPSFVFAVVPPLRDFGGRAIYTIPCTCSASTWAWFAPLFLTAVPVTGPVVYVPYATVPFANYTPSVPSIEHVGGYMPGVQACWIYAGYTCITVPSVGVMTFVGTGL